MVWLSGLLPYGQAEQVFERIGGLHLPDATIWRHVEKHGERLKQYVEAEQSQVSPERILLADARQDHDTPKGVSLDGGMVNIREEGWKEFKAGVVYTIGQRTGVDPQTGETMDLPCAEQSRYTAVLGDVDQFAPALWAIAVEHDLPRAARSSVAADGAEWIWNLATDLFPDSTQIVDWYHATHHLALAAHALFPQDETHALDWYRHMQTPLFRGEIWKITRPLQQASLADHARYFEHHQRRMHYQDFREEGFLIGSGPVESEIKQYKVRLSGPGMRWARPNAERLLVIRSAVLSHQFDALWAAAA